MAKTELTEGVYTASLTPQNDDYSINSSMFVDHCRYLMDAGCAGLVIFGTTGEANSMSVAERKTALEKILKSGLPANNILLGVGTPSLSDTIELSAHALSNGIAKLLILPPYYYKGISDQSLFGFFAHVIEQLNRPQLKIFLYHIPHISGVGFSLEFIRLISGRYPEIITGVKDSSGDWDHMSGLKNEFPQLDIFPGSEKYLLKMSQRGGPGCISASTNITHRLAVNVWQNRNEKTIAEKYQERLTAIRVEMEKFPMIALLKYFRFKLSGDPRWLNIRPPLIRLDENQQKAADLLFAQIENEL